MKIDATKNTVICGDNFEWLNSLPDNTIDFCYIDPPFFSGQDYQIIWGNHAEKAAFSDRRDFGMAGYLLWIKERTSIIQTKLKPNGTIAFHIDDTASWQVRTILEELFPNGYLHEIVWKRSSNPNDSGTAALRRKYDKILLFKNKEQRNYHFEKRYIAETTEDGYNKKDADSNEYYTTVPLLVSGKRKGITGIPWQGIDPNVRGKAGMHWITIHENLEKYLASNLVVFSSKGVPRLKYYLNQNEGIDMSDFWDDIGLISSNDSEALYPTQKPLELITRLITGCTEEGDIVLDCFCGGGTTAEAAIATNRKFIVGDVSPVATKITISRLEKLDYHTFDVVGLGYTKEQLRQVDGHKFEEIVCDITGWTLARKRDVYGEIDAIDGEGNPVEIKNQEKLDLKFVQAEMEKNRGRGYKKCSICAWSYAENVYKWLRLGNKPTDISINILHHERDIFTSNKILWSNEQSNEY